MAEWNFACPDWWQRLQTGRSLLPALPLNSAEADRAVGIYNKFCLPDVAGNPPLGEAGAEWYRDIVRAVFGSLDSNGRRLVKKIFCLVPKKQSKTTNSAALFLTALLFNQRPRADFLVLAPTKLLAQIAFEQAVGMIECDPERFLQKRFYPRDHLKQIDDRLTGAIWKIRAFDLNVTNGIIPAGLLIDELHRIASDPNAARVLRQLIGGMLPIPESFLLYITTQSDQPPKGVFRTELMRARQIRDGLIEGDTLPFIYEFPENIQSDEDKWRDTSLWPSVLPNLNRPFTIADLQKDLADQDFAGASAVSIWASQHLNIQVGGNRANDYWIGADYWEARADVTLDFATLLDRCEVVVVGIDGGGLDDLLGATFLGREKETGRWLSWSRAWAHDQVPLRRKNIAADLADFESDNDLVFVATMQDAFDELADLVVLVEEAGLLAAEGAVGLDPVGVSDIVLTLKAAGIEGETRVVSITQGYRLSGNIKTTEVKLEGKSLLHADQALMTWCVGNAKIELKGNATTITKAQAGSAKIDPLMALFIAVALMGRHPEVARKSSVYEDGRGLMVL